MGRGQSVKFVGGIESWFSGNVDALKYHCCADAK
jgi:hypothetical protein